MGGYAIRRGGGRNGSGHGAVWGPTQGPTLHFHACGTPLPAVWSDSCVPVRLKIKHLFTSDTACCGHLASTGESRLDTCWTPAIQTKPRIKPLAPFVCVPKGVYQEPRVLPAGRKPAQRAWREERDRGAPSSVMDAAAPHLPGASLHVGPGPVEVLAVVVVLQSEGHS